MRRMLMILAAARAGSGECFSTVHSPAAAFVGPAPRAVSWGTAKGVGGHLLLRLRLPAAAGDGHVNEFDLASHDVPPPPSLSTRRSWLGRAASAALAAGGGWSARPRPSSADGSATLDRPLAQQPVIAQSLSLCDPSVSTWRNPTGRVVHLIGTAHISEDSAQLAGNVVREVRPDAVFVELDRKRIARALPPVQTDGSGFADGPTGVEGAGQQQQTEGESSARPGGGGRFAFRERVLQAGSQLVGDAIKGMYKKLESDGFKAGDEFVVAIREGLAVNSAIVLGDRDVEVTLRRLTEALAKTDLKKLLASDSELEKAMDSLMPNGGKAAAVPATPDMTKDQFKQFVETVKARENVRLVMSQLKQAAPEIYSAMVAERDEYMARGLAKLDQFGTMVAVMGIAHVDGVESNLKERGWESVSVPCQLEIKKTVDRLGR